MHFENPFRRVKPVEAAVAESREPSGTEEQTLLEEYEELNTLAAQKHTALTTSEAVDREIGHLEQISADLQWFLVRIEAGDAVAATVVSGLLSSVGHGGYAASFAAFAGTVGVITEVMRRQMKKKAEKTEDRLQLDRERMRQQKTAKA